MNTATRHTTIDRDRALARLRSATTGTAIAGVAAVIGFGSLAAITNPGSHAATVSTGTTARSAAGVTSVGGTLFGVLSGGDDGNGGDDGSAIARSAAAALTPSATLRPSTTTATNIAAPAQVTTGVS